MVLGVATFNFFAETRLVVAGYLPFKIISAGTSSCYSKWIDYGFRKADSRYSIPAVHQ